MAVTIHDEGRAVRDVPLLVQDAIGADGGAVHVAEQRERKLAGLGEGRVAERAVRAYREEDRSALGQALGDLDQAA